MAPTNTGRCRCRAARATHTSWLLSPSSARKITPKDVVAAVGQPARDAVFLAGLAPDRPAHPPLRGGVDGLGQGAPGVQFVAHVVGKVAAMAAVEEVPDRLQVLAGGLGDPGHGQWPGVSGVLLQGAPKAPGLVPGGGDRGGLAGRGGHRLVLGVAGFDGLMNTLPRREAKRMMHFFSPGCAR